MSKQGLTQEEIAALFASAQKGEQPAEQPSEQGPEQAPFAALDPAQEAEADPSPLGLLSDVELELTVELGQSRRSLREILAMGPGSVLELDRHAGEAVDLLVNGRLVARGEVVVIGENYGVRITELVNPEGSQGR
ncbi:flagellar motor switch protein FliN/FliY [Symbiobacterium terraclitae]|uniref:Flagellar motor switch protein FliN/FliY n=1 Tax=Symbiobacterium terraclitae TaxID=557451 RepID=A0ABS4JN79_9FIRM|nr:flagellar motor switch protein FliN [Symbiobacterium terraclitae]MBP2017003.1 flagellar motor switch protein FliN/FliY [Symbiobacterium terraclitae]